MRKLVVDGCSWNGNFSSVQVSTRSAAEVMSTMARRVSFRSVCMISMTEIGMSVKLRWFSSGLCTSSLRLRKLESDE